MAHIPLRCATVSENSNLRTIAGPSTSLAPAATYALSAVDPNAAAAMNTVAFCSHGVNFFTRSLASGGRVAGASYYSGQLLSATGTGRLLVPATKRTRLTSLVKSPPGTSTANLGALSTRELEDDVLSLIADQDGGPTSTAEERSAVDARILELCGRGKRQLPLSDPQLFNRYCVAYTSSTENSPPAGGRFRGRLGRVIFPARGVFQHVVRPDTVVNVIPFKLLGLLCGSVALKGSLCVLDESDFGPNGIGVTFQPPRLMLGGLVFQFANSSTVKLRTPYLSPRLRIGIGSRGSLFAFTRGGIADDDVAREWEIMYGRRTPVIPLVALPLTALGLGLAAVFMSWKAACAGLVAALAIATLFKAKFDPSPLA
jgi:hypothetical protein